MLLGCLAPAAGGDEGCAHGAEFLIVEDSDGALLDVDDVASLDQCLGRGGGEGGAVLERLVL